MQDAVLLGHPEKWGPLHPDGCSQTPRGRTTTCNKDTAKTGIPEAWRKQICPVSLFVICLTFQLYSLPDTLWLSILSIKEIFNLINHPPIENKVILYWELANQVWKACIRVNHKATKTSGWFVAVSTAIESILYQVSPFPSTVYY